MGVGSFGASKGSRDIRVTNSLSIRLYMVHIYIYIIYIYIYGPYIWTIYRRRSGWELGRLGLRVLGTC